MENPRTVTRKDFEKYNEVMRSGEYQMLFEEGRIATGLTEDQYLAIRCHYRELAETYAQHPNTDILLNHL